jgi:hypothetical protein
MSEDVPRNLWHNGGWWVRRDESPAVPRFGEMDQRLSAAITRHLADNRNRTDLAHQPKPPGGTAR